MSGFARMVTKFQAFGDKPLLKRHQITDVGWKKCTRGMKKKVAKIRKCEKNFQ